MDNCYSDTTIEYNDGAKILNIETINDGSGICPHIGDSVALDVKILLDNSMCICNFENNNCYKFTVVDNDDTGWAYSKTNIFNKLVKNMRLGTKLKVTCNSSFLIKKTYERYTFLYYDRCKIIKINNNIDIYITLKNISI